MKWGNSELDTAIEMITNGSDYIEISIALKRSKNSVKSKLLSLGYKLIKDNELIPNNHKKCIICKSVKQFSEFSKNSSQTDGYQTTCRECKNVSDKKYYSLNADKMRKQIHASKLKRQDVTIRFLYEYFKTNKCVDCGESDPIVLDFDHKDGVDKVDSISNMINSCTIKTILEEINKCDVRCANCHRRRTAKQKNWRMLKMFDDDIMNS
jgi:hypothetical protein